MADIIIMVIMEVVLLLRTEYYCGKEWGRIMDRLLLWQRVLDASSMIIMVVFVCRYGVTGSHSIVGESCFCVALKHVLVNYDKNYLERVAARTFGGHPGFMAWT